MEIIAQQIHLPFRKNNWQGSAGNWMGSGIGSSIDFQDHRAYYPGDDPRYINWQIFARSGQYTMKLYREEVNPQVDLVLDVSNSMFIDQRKTYRTLELFYFCLKNALQSGASVKVYQTHGDGWCELSKSLILAGKWDVTPMPLYPDHAPVLTEIPWAYGSMRILISDLLYPEGYDNILSSLYSAKGRGVIFVPYSREEATPDWSGNVDLIDVESSMIHRRQVDSITLERYKNAYLRHFDMWFEQCRRYKIQIAKIPETGEFIEALRHEALENGVVEVWT